MKTSATVIAMDFSLNAAIASCRELVEIWGDDFDQIEGHLESEGFTQPIVDAAIRICGVS
jgi:translation initiation factor 1 (eIF-1/SUI1)